jgi:2-oxo-4-hydroxy-4-carboxy-5-ureidoimidazoline decarboxylase
MNEALKRLNDQNERKAWDDLLTCCGASKWVAKVVAARPFINVESLTAASEAAFETLSRTDWLEAFSHHPKIGDIDSLRTKFASTSAWAGQEQSGTSVAQEETLQQLAEGNETYEQKFGFIFIICATGKSAEEMLKALRERVGNDADSELQNAAEQQKQITRLRLGKLLNS